jgi:hypothetical protein
MTQQNGGQNHNTHLANEFFGNVAKMGHRETTLTNQNCIYEELRGTLNFENVCHKKVHKFLPSRLLSTYLKIKIHRTTILLVVVLHKCKAMALTPKEERRGRSRKGCRGKCLTLR